MWEQGALNEVTIEGLLSETNLEKTTDKTGKDIIRGEFTVRVNQSIDGVEYTSEIPVRVYQKRLKNDGSANAAYASMERIKEDCVSIAVAGNEAEADCLKLDFSCNIAENLFCGRGGNTVSYPIIRTGFANKIKHSEMTSAARFKNVVVIGAINPELDNEGDETGRLILKGILPQYGGKVDAVDFVVTNKKLREFIESNWNIGDTVVIGGYINFVSKVKTVKEESTIGEPMEKKQTVSVKEFIIASAHENPLTEEEGAYSKDDISTALAERKDRERLAKEKTTPIKKGPADFGF